MAAPLAPLVVQMLDVNGDLYAFMSSRPRVVGFWWVTIGGATVGLLVTLSALFRERDAQARSDALQFALEREKLERQATDAKGHRVVIEQRADHARLFDRHGRLDVVVNNAGGSPYVLTADSSAKFNRKIIELNLIGALSVSQHANDKMQTQQQGGAIGALQLGEGFDGADCLEVIKPLKTLKRLTLTNCTKLDDAGLKLAADLKQLDQIENAINRINTPLAHTGNLYAFRQNVNLVRQRVKTNWRTHMDALSNMPNQDS